jgi:hypothetical protein
MKRNIKPRTDMQRSDDFTQFNGWWLSQMMQKLRVDEPTLPGHGRRLLMFRELCLHQRVDSAVFARVARRHGILALRAGPAEGIGRLDADCGTSFDALAPLYTAALRSISGRLSELDQSGLGRGIERKWDVCGVSIEEPHCTSC